MPQLEYEPVEKSPPSGGFGAVLIGLLVGLAACGIYAFGKYWLRDYFIGRVPDSHYEAWLYAAPLAGVTGAAGAALCIWIICRRPSARAYAMFALLWNAWALALVLMSLTERHF
jgi:hypothetical protein